MNTSTIVPEVTQKSLLRPHHEYSGGRAIAADHIDFSYQMDDDS
jgi:hypothetical protein